MRRGATRENYLLAMRALLTYALALPLLAFGQRATTLAEDLGYPPDARLLIVHADDLGMANSVNQASFEAITRGSVNSASVMMPTPWVTQVAAFAKTHPDADIGLHLTLTSEWRDYRWGPMARESVGSLLDSTHYLHHRCPEFAADATLADVERELRAQVEQALRLGIRPTHLDTHMGCLVWTRPEFFGAYLQLGRDYDLPVLADRESTWGQAEVLAPYIQPTDMLVDRVVGVPPAAQGNFRAAYDSLLTALRPGVSVLLLHCGYEDAELTAATAPQMSYGAAWRQEDFAYFTSAHLPALLEREGIELVTWRELWAAWKAQAARLRN